MQLPISLGNQGFASLRENHCFYIDKTDFIREWWEEQDVVTLITRPRRFGKTLNLNMMECFFSIQYKDRSDLFEDLSIWNDQKYQKLQGTYPVISLSFANIKGRTFEETKRGILQILVKLFSIHSYIKDDKILNSEDWEFINSVNMDMPDDVASLTLMYLSDYLSRFYQKKVLIFLDEYDTPLQEAYIHGYWDELTGFLRSLLNASFKTNPYLERGLMTGITRISKESIFCDLNNLSIITTTSEKYSHQFGFTENEVFKALKSYHLSDKESLVKSWYDGFTFGSQKDIYNPWSITCFLKEKKLRPYWANTSSNQLVGKLVREGSAQIKMVMEDLLAGKSFQTEIDEEIIFDILDTKADIVDAADVTELPEVQGRVEFSHVSFTYDKGTPAETKVLSDVSFVVEPGETIALVGPTGAGKTTIVNLISRFYDIEDGVISVDGYDLTKISIESLRRQMGVMTQDNFIFHGTVRENILYGKLDATDEEMIAAAKAVNAHEFIMKMEKGYDTELKEHGAGLSIGQRQLIAFARTMISMPKILILDEPTRGIDVGAKFEIYKMITELAEEGVGIIFISSELPEILNLSTRVITMHEGQKTGELAREELSEELVLKYATGGANK